MFNGTSRNATEARKGYSNLYSFWTGKNHHDRMRQWILWKNMTHITTCATGPVCVSILSIYNPFVVHIQSLALLSLPCFSLLYMLRSGNSVHQIHA
jgi:hypothetical protein